MSKGPSMKRSLVVGVASTFSGAAIQLLVMPFVGRHLGAEGLTDFYGLLAIASLLTTPVFGLFPTMVSAWKSGVAQTTLKHREEVSLQLTVLAAAVGLGAWLLASALCRVVWPSLPPEQVVMAAFLGALPLAAAPLEAIQAYRGEIEGQYKRTLAANAVIIVLVAAGLVAKALTVPILLAAFLGARIVASGLNAALVFRSCATSFREAWAADRRPAVRMGVNTLQYTATNSLGSWLAHFFPLLALRGKVPHEALAVLGASMLLVPSWNNAVNILMRTVQSLAPEMRDRAVLCRHKKRVYKSLGLVAALGLVPVAALLLMGPWFFGKAFKLDLSGTSPWVFALIGVYCLVIGFEEAAFGAAVTLTPARHLAWVRLAKGVVVGGVVAALAVSGRATDLGIWGLLLVSGMAAAGVCVFVFEVQWRRRVVALTPVELTRS